VADLPGEPVAGLLHGELLVQVPVVGVVDRVEDAEQVEGLVDAPALGERLPERGRVAVPRSLVAFLADQLRQAQRQGATSRDIDPDKEATTMVATLTGLASGVLGNNFTVEEAAAIIDYTLDRLFQRAKAPPVVGVSRGLVQTSAHASLSQQRPLRFTGRPAGRGRFQQNGGFIGRA
jgi:hypothetical protein